MKLIDKDALVAKIERRRDKITKGIFSIPLTGRDRASATFEYEILGKIKDIIDTLEVKEVDLDKELSYDDYIRFFAEHPNFSDDWGFDEAWVFAEYFFKLGLKAQKGE